jgi:hypothetical protein
VKLKPNGFTTFQENFDGLILSHAVVAKQNNYNLSYPVDAMLDNTEGPYVAHME